MWKRINIHINNYLSLNDFNKLSILFFDIANYSISKGKNCEAMVYLCSSLRCDLCGLEYDVIRDIVLCHRNNMRISIETAHLIYAYKNFYDQQLVTNFIKQLNIPSEKTDIAIFDFALRDIFKNIFRSIGAYIPTDYYRNKEIKHFVQDPEAELQDFIRSIGAPVNKNIYELADTLNIVDHKAVFSSYSICPSCNSNLYNENVKFCPYCGKQIK